MATNPLATTGLVVRSTMCYISTKHRYVTTVQQFVLKPSELLLSVYNKCAGAGGASSNTTQPPFGHKDNAGMAEISFTKMGTLVCHTSTQTTHTRAHVDKLTLSQLPACGNFQPQASAAVQGQVMDRRVTMRAHTLASRQQDHHHPLCTAQLWQLVQTAPAQELSHNCCHSAEWNEHDTEHSTSSN